MAVLGFHHAGVTVTDVDASLRFYRDLLGLEVVARRRISEPYVFEFTGTTAQVVDVVFLAVPGSDAQVELLAYETSDRRAAASRPSDPANAHLCLVVDDLAEIDARLRAAGFGARSDGPVDIPVGPNAGGRLLYAVDPDGAFVELLERPRQGAARTQ